jgi:HSP20 family molecular chaperone IbpA
MTNFSLNNFNSFFDDFVYGFGKPRNLIFNCKTKDIMPSFWEKTESGFKCTCRTVGICPKDVAVTLEDDCIHVKGETEWDNYKYNTSYELPLCEDVLNNIKSVKYKTENGITIIYIDLDRPEKRKIKIEQI